MTTTGSCSRGTNMQAGAGRGDSVWPSQDNDLRSECQWSGLRACQGGRPTRCRQARSVVPTIAGTPQPSEGWVGRHQRVQSGQLYELNSIIKKKKNKKLLQLKTVTSQTQESTPVYDSIHMRCKNQPNTILWWERHRKRHAKGLLGSWYHVTCHT